MIKTFVILMFKTALSIYAITFDRILEPNVSIIQHYANRKELINPEWCFLSILFLSFFKYSCKDNENYEKKIFASQIVISLLAALFILLGRSFSVYDSWNLIFVSEKQFIGAMIALLGWFIIIYDGLNIIIFNLSNLQVKGRKSVLLERENKEEKKFEKLSFLIIVICWLPYFIIKIPGNVPHDGMWQLTKWFGYSGEMSNHHPWFVTMFFGSLMKIGMVISDNVGVMLICICQILICAFIYAHICKKARTFGGDIAGYLSIAFFAIVPVWGNYSSTVIKDTLFTAIFALYFSSFIEMYYICNVKADIVSVKSRIAVFIVLNILVCLMRNDGIYRVLPACFSLILLCKYKKLLLMKCFTFIFIAMILYNFLLFNVLNINKGSSAEMLSIPFQQTARYIRDCSNDITTQERLAVEAVLDFESIGEAYNEELSDPVKATFHANDNKAMLDYFSAWLSMGIRHPGVYLQATLNNCYGYFYPFSNNYERSAYQNYIKGEPVNNGYFDIDYIWNENIRKGLDSWCELWRILPGLSLLSNPGTYTWITMFVFLLLVIKKKNRDLCIMIVPMLQILICVASPLNGNLRYAMPLMAITPLLLSWGINVFVRGKEDRIEAE